MEFALHPNLNFRHETLAMREPRIDRLAERTRQRRPASTKLAHLGAALCLGLLAVLPRAVGEEGEADYLAAELRAAVEALKADVRRQPSSTANARAKAETLLAWIDAWALSGRYVPVDATQVAAGVLAYPNTEGRIARLDAAIAELALLDDEPEAVGTLTADLGPFVAASHATIRQTLTVGAKDIETGGGVVVARHWLTRLAFQTEEAAADNYVTVASSNPTVRFAKATMPMRGMHGSTRQPSLVFRVTSGQLTAGDQVTITYGDTTGGSRGLRLPSFSTDQLPLPLYLDFDGNGPPVSVPIAPIKVVGGPVAGVHGFAPSVVAVGERFALWLRAQDRFYNRATGKMPGWEVEANGKPVASVAAGTAARVQLAGLAFDAPGVYRFAIRSADGAIVGTSNPVLVEAAPQRRIYWGDTHGHSGFAEGVGTAERFMRWARDDARLDYVAHSEHDIWMDEREWQVLADNVRRFSSEEFVAFLGYEWTVRNFQGGHHNVLFRTAAGRQRIPAQRFGTLTALYQGLRRHHDPGDVVVIPHAHQAGDYRQSDPALEPLVEIMSQQGTFEWFARSYLRQGHQVGFIAASDNHLAQPGYSAPHGARFSQRGGLGALLAPAKTRDALWAAMKNRAAYATTGDRIILDFTVNDAGMGERTAFAAERRVAGRVIGTAPLRSVEVVRNDETIWERDYLTDAVAKSADGDYLLVFASPSQPYHPGDNPRGWRRWRGTASIEGGTIAAAAGANFHNADDQSVDVTDGASLAFSTYTRGGTSTIRLTLKDVRRNAELRLRLGAAREFGGSAPRFRPHQPVPAAKATLLLREMRDGAVQAVLPFDGFRDAVTLRRIVAAGELDVAFAFTDSAPAENGDGEATPAGRHDDYYYLRVVQANDALAWSSPIWVGGYPPR